MELALQIFLTIYFFYFGALLNSFYNVVGIRTLSGSSIIPRSRCPKCNHQLRWLDVIPIFGFIINKGHCHFCKEKIHIKYLLIELYGGLWMALTYFFFGFSLAFLNAVFICAMVTIITVAMYEYYKMMTKCIYIFIPIFIAMSLIMGNYLVSIYGAILAALLIFIYSFVNPKAKKYFALVIVSGYFLGIYAFIVFVVFFGLFYMVKLFAKKFPTIYLYNFALLLALVFGNSIFSYFLNIFN